MLEFIMYPIWIEPRNALQLNISNILLGAAVVVLVFYFVYVILNAVIRRLKEQKRRRRMSADLSGFLSKLGVTMHDGGERKSEETRRKPKKGNGRKMKCRAVLVPLQW
ncbi:MAG: hypothetical protein ABSF91_07830 [Bacteroidota bacterium]